MNKTAFYIQNKRIAQIISKRYNINYKESQEIVDLVFNETIRSIDTIKKKEEKRKESNE